MVIFKLMYNIALPTHIIKSGPLCNYSSNKLRCSIHFNTLITLKSHEYLQSLQNKKD